MTFSKETLKSFAQSKGISNIDDDALRILGQDLEYRLKEVCQEASKFMLAAHRTKLNTEDINNALISRNVEPLFGYDSNETLVFRGLPCSIYYVPDEEIDLEEYLERPLPKIPLKPYVQSHWLAIEGTQPPIQQNPVLIEKQAPSNQGAFHVLRQNTTNNGN
jgi:transcription initiation factor TFIID subunit 6